MDVFKCISDVTNLKTEIKNFLAQNVTVEAIIEEITKIEPELQAALSDCGIADVTLPNIFAPGSDQIKVSFDFLRCLQDLNSIVDLLGEAGTDISSGNIINVIQDLLKLKTAVGALMGDCISTNATSVAKGRFLAEKKDILVGGALECIGDLETTVNDLKNFLTVLQGGDISDIMIQLNVVVKNLKVLINDCDLANLPGFDVLKRHLDTMNPINCLNDIDSLVTIIETIIQNYNNSQYEELVSNLLVLVDTIKQSVADCVGSNVTLTSTREFIIRNEMTIECIGGLSKAALQLKQLITSPRSEILVNLNKTLEEFRTAFGICDVTCPFLNRIVRINPSACVSDAKNLITFAAIALNHAENYDINALISDVENLVSFTEYAIVDCTGGNISESTKELTFDIFECIGDIQAEVLNLELLRDGVTSGNLSNILIAFKAIVSGLNPLLDNCGLNATIQNFGHKLHIDPVECINDFGVTIDNINQVIADYKAQNWTILIEDVLSAVEQVQQLAGDCFDYNLTRFINPQCIGGLQNVVEEVSTIIDNLSEVSTFDDIIAIARQITVTVEDVEDLEGVCGLNLASAFKNKNTVLLLALGETGETNTCWGSIKKLGAAFFDIVSTTDTLQKVAKIFEIKELLNEVKGQCLGIKTEKKVDTLDSIVKFVTQAKGLRI